MVLNKQPAGRIRFDLLTLLSAFTLWALALVVMRLLRFPPTGFVIISLLLATVAVARQVFRSHNRPHLVTYLATMGYLLTCHLVLSLWYMSPLRFSIYMPLFVLLYGAIADGFFAAVHGLAWCLRSARLGLRHSHHKAPDVDWIVAVPMPVPVRLHYHEPEAKHSLTPELIRQRYAEDFEHSSLVCWQSTAADLFGLIAGIDDATWRSSSVQQIELAHQRPAQGHGHIHIAVNGELALSYDGCSDESLEWFQQVHGLMAERFTSAATNTELGSEA